MLTDHMFVVEVFDIENVAGCGLLNLWRRETETHSGNVPHEDYQEHLGETY